MGKKTMCYCIAMKIFNSLFLLFIFLPITDLYSQKYHQYLPGFVVTNNNDTINGKIKAYRNEEISFIRIRLIDNKNNKVKFLKKDIKCYKRADELYFQKRYERPWELRLFSRYVFMRVIIEGKVSLYEFHYSKVPNIFYILTIVNPFLYVQVEGIAFTIGVPIFFSIFFIHHIDYYLEKQYSDLYLVRKMNLKNKLADYFSDNNQLAEKIRNNKKLKYRDIENIVQYYNSSKY